MKKLILSLINDTLKKKDPETGDLRWSRTSLTMFVSFVVALHMAIDDFVRNGFNEYVFWILMAVATGVKIADALSKNLKKRKQDELTY